MKKKQITQKTESKSQKRESINKIIEPASQPTEPTNQSIGSSTQPKELTTQLTRSYYLFLLILFIGAVGSICLLIYSKWFSWWPCCLIF